MADPHRQVLATDLDGTLIPLKGNPRHVDDLQRLTDAIRQHRIELVFVTGRHLASVQTAIQQYQLPAPDWIISDVGTSVYRRGKSGDFTAVEPYIQRLEQILPAARLRQVDSLLTSEQKLRRQEAEKQGPFKLSFYTDAASLDLTVAAIESRLADQFPIQIIASVDPFNGDGLIDILPQEVSKSFALRWWSEHLAWSADQIVFAGDSGNDLAALVGGYRAILVGNASDSVVQSLEAHRNYQPQLVYRASQSATSGLWEGLLHWQLFS